MSEQKIIDMPEGTIGWTVPWALQSNTRNELWIFKNYHAIPDKSGTADLRFTRRGEGVEIRQNDLMHTNIRMIRGSGFEHFLWRGALIPVTVVR